MIEAFDHIATAIRLQFDVLHLKCCILGEIAKTRTSGKEHSTEPTRNPPNWHVKRGSLVQMQPCRKLYLQKSPKKPRLGAYQYSVCSDIRSNPMNRRSRLWQMFPFGVQDHYTVFSAILDIAALARLRNSSGFTSSL